MSKGTKSGPSTEYGACTRGTAVRPKDGLVLQPVVARYFRLVITSAYASPVRIAEVTFLRGQRNTVEPNRAGADSPYGHSETTVVSPADKPNLRPGIKWWLQKSGARAFWDWPPQGTAVLTTNIRPTAWPIAAAAKLWTSRPAWMPTAGSIGTRPRAAGRSCGSATRCWARKSATPTPSSSPATRPTCSARRASTATSRIWSSRCSKSPRSASAGRLKVLHIDSYEIGADVAGLQPTWSHIFREEFRQRRGYDVLRYLPALAGRIVDSREITDRFLWDIRRTIADLMAEKFWARYVELTHQHGLKAEGETGYGSYPLPQIDALQCAGALDVPMGEFWLHETYMTQLYPFCHTIRTVANAAHVYGRPIVQSEAFTTGTHFMESPADLKALGDEQYCAGLNRIVFHQSTHQAQLDFKPGWQYGAGTHIDRCLTWWDQVLRLLSIPGPVPIPAASRRFQRPLRYFYGEGAAAFVPAKDHLNPPLPPGNDFDAINADVLLNRLRVEDKSLVLPNGQSYSRWSCRPIDRCRRRCSGRSSSLWKQGRERHR